MAYKSNLEKEFVKYLEKKKLDINYECKVLYYKDKYIPDFRFKKLDGTWMYIECKGYHYNFKGALKKLKLIKKHNPDLDLRIMWQSGTIKTSPTMTVEDWSTKYKFKYTIGPKLPKEWLDELE